MRRNIILLEKPFEELVRRAAEGDIGRGIVAHLDALDDRADRLALLEMLAGNLLRLGDVELVAVLVEDEGLLAPCLVTDEAKEAALAYGTTDNRRTYNNTSSVNLTGNNFYVRDEQDIRSLAIEIAALTKRQQRGKGLRMA